MALSRYLQSLLLGVAQDTNGSTIFNAPPGILEFGFSKDLTFRPFREGL